MVHLVLLEQYKNMHSESVATFTVEHNIQTASQAGMLADEWELTHSSRQVRLQSGTMGVVFTHALSQLRDPAVPQSHEPCTSNDPSLIFDLTCNYCLGKGQWKSDRPVLKAKNAGTKFCGSPVTPAALAAPVPVSTGLVIPSETPISTSACVAVRKVVFKLLISESFVLLIGNDIRVPVKILKDTKASESFILEFMLPFSSESHTGNSLLIHGIGLTTLSVPLHKVTLMCDLVQCDVELDVWPVLLVDGMSFILGNSLDGRYIELDNSPPLVVTDTPPLVSGTNESAQQTGKKSFSCLLTICCPFLVVSCQKKRK